MENTEVICICGSTKLKDEILYIAKKLSLEGKAILHPIIFSHADNITITDDELSNLKKAHLKKIELCDSILVVCKDNYIGEGTREEIEYAKTLNKKILFYGN